MKKIEELSNEEFANYVRSEHEVIKNTTKGIIVQEEYSGNSSLIVISITSNVIRAFENVLTGGSPLFELEHLRYLQSIPIKRPPFKDTYMGDYTYPKENLDLIIDLQKDYLNLVMPKLKKEQYLDLNDDGTLTNKEQARLAKAAANQVKEAVLFAEKVLQNNNKLKKSSVYLIAKSIKGLRLKKVSKFVPQNSQDEKLLRLFQSGESFATQAVEICITLGKTDLLSYALENILDYDIKALLEISKY